MPLQKTQWHKYFRNDFDNPPRLEEIYTCFLFAYLVLSQAILQTLRKFFLQPKNRLIKDSQKLLPKYQTNYAQTPDTLQLAGNQHEISRDFKSASSFQTLYNIGALARMKSCFHREVLSAPSALVQVCDGVKLNFCSYNYLGFAGGQFNSQLLDTVREHGFGGLPRTQQQHPVLNELEKEIAVFLGKPTAITHNMGFDTNALCIPAIVAPNSIIFSDSLNHSSLVQGIRRAGVKIQPFKHTMMALQKQLEEEDLSQYSEVWVVVEGLYSMEGCYLDLIGLIQLKKKFNFKIYIDEAHSVGGTGTNGHGICEKFGIDPAEIDVLMGTFTKSFSSSGGYLASSVKLIDRLKRSPIWIHTQPLQPICAQQILCCLKFMRTPEGLDRIKNLHQNALFLRNSLKALKFTVYGDEVSPIIPVLFYCPTKMKFCQDYLLKRNIAVVQVGFPAVPMVSGRMRFCVSSAHSRQQLDYLLTCMDDLGNLTHLKYEK